MCRLLSRECRGSAVYIDANLVSIICRNKDAVQYELAVEWHTLSVDGGGGESNGLTLLAGGRCYRLQAQQVGQKRQSWRALPYCDNFGKRNQVYSRTSNARTFRLLLKYQSEENVLDGP